jgi:hypothetical protein
MKDANGQEVADPAAAGAEGGASGASAGDGKVVDQEIEVTLPTGEKTKIKTSDIFDDKGVPFKNRLGEANRRSQETEAELERIRSTQHEGGDKPVKEEQVSEEELNRMFMTGEGAKAMRIIINQQNVKKVVHEVIQERDIRTVTAAKYPDLGNPASPFFKRVAVHMANKGLYNHPEGLALASAKVAEEMEYEGIEFSKGVKRGSPEGQRASGTGVTVAGGGSGSSRAGGGTPELDAEGKALCAKLGLDPTKVAARLEKRLASTGHREDR